MLLSPDSDFFRYFTDPAGRQPTPSPPAPPPAPAR
jgi:hypothetical protein